MILGIFSLLSLLFLWIAFRIKKSDKPVILWANSTEKLVVKDVKDYNISCYRLMRNYAILIFLIGLLVSTEKMIFIILGYLSVVFVSLGLIVVYSLIESKHRIN